MSSFRTEIQPPATGFPIQHRHQVGLIGSCFSEHIGDLLELYKYQVLRNPFGILYNPHSIAESMEYWANDALFSAEDLVWHQEQWHSFKHHSDFSNASQTACLEHIHQTLLQQRAQVPQLHTLLLTLGSAYVYERRDTGEIVGNCHRFAQDFFVKRRLSVAEIAAVLQKGLRALWQKNPTLRVVFTVSPVRHWRDGAHENQLSKSALLLAIDVLQQTFPAQVQYFPAYELLMDDLRDYRFYGADLLHPSPEAVQYIWQKFRQAFLSADDFSLLEQLEKLQKAARHRPRVRGTQQHLHFIHQQLLQLQQLTLQYPYLDVTAERAHFLQQLEQ
ncbi:MAG: GSCFA domain-containing protein [Sphingobacteriales bacterium]|nr:GSCFA domain-containing protein [Sphingobacteriales bacterium]